MLREIFHLELSNIDSLSIIVDRKNVSSCKLKVFPSQRVKLSVPAGTTSDWINGFLQRKKNWIVEKLENFKKTNGYESTEIIRQGMSIRMLGQDMIFSIYKFEKKAVSLENKTIRIGLPDISDEKEITRIFEAWWRNQAFSVYSEILAKVYPVIEKHGINKPVLLIKKMKTLWGSSSPHKDTITINLYLLKARKPCIEYVILHEIIHFLFCHHDQKFYDFLTLHMPDWKDRKKILDKEVVQGLKI